MLGEVRIEAISGEVARITEVAHLADADAGNRGDGSFDCSVPSRVNGRGDLILERLLVGRLVDSLLHEGQVGAIAVEPGQNRLEDSKPLLRGGLVELLSIQQLLRDIGMVRWRALCNRSRGFGAPIGADFLEGLLAILEGSGDERLDQSVKLGNRRSPRLHLGVLRSNRDGLEGVLLPLHMIAETFP